MPKGSVAMPSNLRSEATGRIHHTPHADGRIGADMARRLRDDLPRDVLTDDEDRALSDLARGRYAIIARLEAISRKCLTDHGRYAVAEIFIDRLTPPTTEQPGPAIVAEDEAEHAANVAVRRYTFERSPIAARVACECLTAHQLRIARLRESLALVAGGALQ